MEGGEFGEALLEGVGAEGQAEGDVVDGVGLGGVGDYGRVGDRDLDGRGHALGVEEVWTLGDMEVLVGLCRGSFMAIGGFVFSSLALLR